MGLEFDLVVLVDPDTVRKDTSGVGVKGTVDAMSR
jgi:hypothetical protein